MRLAVLIWVAAFGMTVRADDAFVPVDLESGTGYIVPESYAAAHQADFVSNIPSEERIQGFWTPTALDVTVADRVFRERIHEVARDPALLFPGMAKRAASDFDDPTENLEYQKKELGIISDKFDAYTRQYVGIILKKKKLIFCNYSVGTMVEASTDYVFTDKVFVAESNIRFLQCRYDPEEKKCLNVSTIGAWLPVVRREE